MEFDPSRAAKDTDDARKLRKVKVEMDPEESQIGSLSSSLYTTYFLPDEESSCPPTETFPVYQSDMETELSDVLPPNGVPSCLNQPDLHLSSQEEVDYVVFVNIVDCVCVHQYKGTKIVRSNSSNFIQLTYHWHCNIDRISIKSMLYFYL